MADKFTRAADKQMATIFGPNYRTSPRYRDLVKKYGSSAGILEASQSNPSLRSSLQAQAPSAPSGDISKMPTGIGTKNLMQRPGTINYEQSRQEREAGVTPPSYEGVRDIATGELLSQYRFDPYGGEALKALKEQAFATGESPWMQMQNQLLTAQAQEARDQLAKQNARNLSEATAAQARFGGISSGARSRAANEAIRSGMIGSQGLNREVLRGRLGIGAEDISRREGLLKSFGDLETKGQEFNIGQLTGDITRKSAFDVNRYNELMRAWGAGKSADAQRAAASGGGKK